MGAIRYMVVATALFLGFPIMVSFAGAQEFQGRKWGMGIQAGSSFVTQDINNEAPETVGKMGPIVSGDIVYVMQDGALGLIVEWETHQVKEANVALGDATTISILPFTELRLPATEAITPYISFGLGININSFDESSGVCSYLGVPSCKIEPNNTFAVRINGGIEYSVTQNLALNTGVAWKLNNGHVNITGIGFNYDVDANLNVLSLLLGLHYYF